MIILQSFGSGLAQLFFPIAIVVVAYFFILRPEQTRRKKQSEFVSNLKKGDMVVYAKGNNLLNENIRNAASFLRNFQPEPGIGVELGISIKY